MQDVSVEGSQLSVEEPRLASMKLVKELLRWQSLRRRRQIPNKTMALSACTYRLTSACTSIHSTSSANGASLPSAL